MVGLARDEPRYGGSGSRYLVFPDIFTVGLEEVPHLGDSVVSYAQKVLVWVRRVVEILRSINHEIFPDFVESLCKDVR